MGAYQFRACLEQSIAGSSESDLRNISFALESRAARISFLAFLGHELSLRGASLEGLLEEQ